MAIERETAKFSHLFDEPRANVVKIEQPLLSSDFPTLISVAFPHRLHPSFASFKLGRDIIRKKKLNFNWNGMWEQWCHLQKRKRHIFKSISISMRFIQKHIHRLKAIKSCFPFKLLVLSVQWNYTSDQTIEMPFTEEFDVHFNTQLFSSRRRRSRSRVEGRVESVLSFGNANRSIFYHTKCCSATLIDWRLSKKNAWRTDDGSNTLR